MNKNILIDSADRINPKNPERFVDIPPVSPHKTHISEPSQGGGFWKLIIAITSILATLTLAAFVGHWVVSYFGDLQAGIGSGWELAAFGITKFVLFFGLPLSLVAIAVKAAWGWAQGVSNEAFQKSVVWLQDTIPVHRKAIEANYTPLCNPMFDAVHMRQTQVDTTRWQHSDFHAVSTFSPTIHLDNSVKSLPSGNGGGNGGGGDGDNGGPFDPAKVQRLANTTVDLLPYLRQSDGQRLLLGRDVEGQDVYGDVHAMMHACLAAKTGGGKTVTMFSNALQLACNPDIEIAIADHHVQQLSALEHTGAVWKAGVPRDLDDTVHALQQFLAEIRQRSKLFLQAREALTKITGKPTVGTGLPKYNHMADVLRRHGLDFPHLKTSVAFTDEMTSLMASSPDAQKAVKLITAEGRKYGCYFVGAATDWKASVVDTSVRDAFYTRYIMPGVSKYLASVLLQVSEEQAVDWMRPVRAKGMALLWRQADPEQPTLIRTPFLNVDDDDTLVEALEIVSERRNPTKALEQKDDVLLASLLRSDRSDHSDQSDESPEKPEKAEVEQTGLSGLSGLELKERKRLLVRAVLQANPSMSSNEVREAIGGDRNIIQELVREVKAELSI